MIAPLIYLALGAVIGWAITRLRDELEYRKAVNHVPDPDLYDLPPPSRDARSSLRRRLDDAHTVPEWNVLPDLHDLPDTTRRETR